MEAYEAYAPLPIVLEMILKGSRLASGYGSDCDWKATMLAVIVFEHFKEAELNPNCEPTMIMRCSSQEGRPNH